jgi:UDP-N-acetylglucosamine:LPS N-acetylglucosamine transferase
MSPNPEPSVVAKDLVSGSMRSRIRVLAAASGGGHWTQLLKLRPAFEDCEVLFVGVSEDYRLTVADAAFVAVPDVTRSNRRRIAKLCTKLAITVARFRPDVVVTTGAAPGLIAVIAGKAAGARTIWIDSIANCEELSGSGRLARRFSDLWLTQWPDLESPSGPWYRGRVL